MANGSTPVAQPESLAGVILDEPVVETLFAHTAPALSFEDPTTDIAGVAEVTAITEQLAAVIFEEPARSIVFEPWPMVMMQGDITAWAERGIEVPAKTNKVASDRRLAITNGRFKRRSPINDFFIYL